MSDGDAKIDKSAAEGEEKKSSPTAGLFGFAGPTRFHPGKMPERRDASAVKFEDDLRDDTGGHSTGE